MQVRCFTTEALERELPCERVAVVAIADPGSVRRSADQWGPVLNMRFFDLEWDAARVGAEGWRWLEQDGLFVPSMGTPLRRFLDCDVVRECDALWVHCDSGGRAAAVGRYASERLECELEEGDGFHMNDTVYALLCDPRAFDADSKPTLAPTLFAQIAGAVRQLRGTWASRVR